MMEQIKRRLARVFWFTLALVFLFESWLWDHVKEWLRALGRSLGVERFEHWFADFVSRLSPVATLVVFVVPFATVLPLKIIAVEAIAHGHVLTGVAFIFVAKTLALGVTAFLFDHCRDKLLQMEWFARFYSIVLDVRAWAQALVAPVRLQIHEISAVIRRRAALAFGDSRSAVARRITHLRALTRRRGPA